MGAWLAGAGVTAVIGYLISTVAAGGRHPGWPYLLFVSLAIAGAALYAVGQSGSQTSRGSHRAAVQAMKPSNSGKPQGKFYDLADGAKVRSGYLVNGTVTNSLPGTEPWLPVRSVNNQVFENATKLFLDMHNRFRVPIDFGGPFRYEYLLFLVLANRETAGQFDDYHLDEMTDFPPDVRILDQRRVVLG